MRPIMFPSPSFVLGPSVMKRSLSLRFADVCRHYHLGTGQQNVTAQGGYAEAPAPRLNLSRILTISMLEAPGSRAPRERSPVRTSLVERARDGDDVAFAELVDLDGGRCYATAFRILRDVERAQDAVQPSLRRPCWSLPWAASTSFVPGRTAPSAVPGRPPSPSPQPTPTPSPSPTPEPPTAGTITLTDAGCTWVGNPTPVTDQTRIVIAVRNDTATFGNFTLYKLNESRTWEEAAAWVTAENEALIAGEPRNVPADFATDRATSDALAGLENRLVATVSTGAYGVMCSANQPPPGAIFNVYLVGPLEVE